MLIYYLHKKGVRVEKPKLLITASTFPRHINDTEPSFILDLAKSLLPYFDVTVLVPSAPKVKNSEVMDGVKVVRYRYFPIQNFETLCYPGAIIPRIKEKKIRILLVPFLVLALYINIYKIIKDFDVVHAHWIIPQGFVQSLFNKPFLMTGHGADVTSLNTGIFKIIKKMTLKRANHITLVSRKLKDELCSMYSVNCGMDIVSMGCSTDNFSKAHRTTNYFRQDNKKIVLFVGRLAEKKGVTYLIDAMKYVDAILIIVGDGPLKSELMEQAKPFNDKIVFLGAKSKKELSTIYASSDIFVMPSIVSKDGDMEGLGLVGLEAMASGIPVIGTKTGGIPEIICDGENGLLVEPENSHDIAKKINLLIQDDELREKLGQNGQMTASKYDYKLIGEKYAEILMGLLKSR